MNPNVGYILMIRFGSWFFPIVLISALLSWMMIFNQVSHGYIGVTQNAWTGKIGVQSDPGWHLTSPFVRVANIPINPKQVCLSAGPEIVTCKTVRFKPEGVVEFVNRQGFYYYSTIGQSRCITSECGGIENIMRSYAFSPKPVSFLEIIESSP